METSFLILAIFCSPQVPLNTNFDAVFFFFQAFLFTPCSLAYLPNLPQFTFGTFLVSFPDFALDCRLHYEL